MERLTAAGVGLTLHLHQQPGLQLVALGQDERRLLLLCGEGLLSQGDCASPSREARHARCRCTRRVSRMFSVAQARVKF
eukprot:scaffold32140_cov101-Isochrysis_galbana.AAC.2